jgi:hypothetical protein
MKGLNAEDRGCIVRQHWEDLLDPVVVGVDAKRFDQHTGRPALKYEHKVYMRHCPKNRRRRLKWLLNMQLTTYGNCYTKTGNIRYKIPGGRCSGDVNTSMGNIIIMCHLFYDYLESLNIRYRFVNDGDDGLIFIERDDLNKLSGMTEWFETYGYRMSTEEAVDVFEHIEFCQCHPVWDGEMWIMCRHPDVVLTRDAYTTKSVETKGQWDYYRSAIGNCGIACTGGIPVLQSFYLSMTKDGKSVRSQDTSTGLYWMALGLDRVVKPIHPSARLSFFKAFDITPDEQIVLEQSYSRCQPRYEPAGTHQYLRI